jgi:hypothetical protein
MANAIEYTNIKPIESSLVSVSSRYAYSTVLYYGQNKCLTFTTYKRNVYTPTSGDKYAVIPAGMEYRPDLVSQEAYGVPDFWYKIMEANKMSDILEFKTGMNIIIPGAVL